MTIESVSEFYDRTEFGHEIHRRWREESRTEGREEGREKGRTEGREEGREEGRTEGREKGRTEGREEGDKKGAARMLTAMLSDRFGDHPQIPAIVEHLCRDSDDLARVRAVNGPRPSTTCSANCRPLPEAHPCPPPLKPTRADGWDAMWVF